MNVFRDVTAHVLKAGEMRYTRPVPIDVQLLWREEDPLAVQLVIDQGAEEVGIIVWTVDRNHMLYALDSSFTVGSGDVQWRRISRDKIVACLRSPDGHSDVAFDRGAVSDFLEATIAVIPVGSECLSGALDAFLEEVLG